MIILGKFEFVSPNLKKHIIIMYLIPTLDIDIPNTSDLVVGSLWRRCHVI